DCWRFCLAGAARIARAPPCNSLAYIEYGTYGQHGISREHKRRLSSWTPVSHGQQLHMCTGDPDYGAPRATVAAGALTLTAGQRTRRQRWPIGPPRYRGQLANVGTRAKLLPGIAAGTAVPAASYVPGCIACLLAMRPGA